MIIYLSAELVDNCQLKSETPRKVELFENLAIARRDGKHFLIGDRDVFLYLSNLAGLSYLAKSIYNRILKRFPTEHTILSEDSFTFIIGTNDLFQTNSITFNINNLRSDSFCHYNNLLLENTVDTYIYEKAVEFYKSKKNLEAIECFWDLRNGGGTTSYTEFERLNNLKSVYTFAILDSDKICPTSPLGGTASQFLNYQSYFGGYKIIDAHEVENLIPKQIYSLYVNSKNDAKLTENLYIIDLDSEIFRYTDIKKGIKKFTIANSGEATKDFYTTNLNISSSGLQCTCVSKSNCNCFLFNPMSRNIYSEVKDFIKQQGLEILNFINGFLEIIYLDIGASLFWIFCRSNRINVS